ncbi:hypothetical protein E2C01_028933 [Portunus trituberculatus]|uniref:Uncharacterized protein n=1 Tax=Portunus trituberculatus TaxID=210409 RepID=A0A5B7EQV4_PORTR|nr:hypothetical protein [Portunus trituberculatus]
MKRNVALRRMKSNNVTRLLYSSIEPSEDSSGGSTSPSNHTVRVSKKLRKNCAISSSRGSFKFMLSISATLCLATNTITKHPAATTRQITQFTTILLMCSLAISEGVLQFLPR